VNQLDRDRVPQAPPRCRGFVTNLVLRCGRGDEAAIGLLLDLFYAPVLADAARHGRPRPDDEAVSDGFVRLWGAAATFTPGAQCAVEWVMGHLTARVPDDSHALAAS
jgi:hypothetical protein